MDIKSSPVMIMLDIMVRIMNMVRYLLLQDETEAGYMDYWKPIFKILFRDICVNMKSGETACWAPKFDRQINEHEHGTTSKWRYNDKYALHHSSAKKCIGAALHPFTALSLFLIDQETCLLESQGWKDSTMVRLFEILQQILVKSLDRETQLLDAVKSICDANIKVYQEILNTSERLAYSSAIDQHAQQGIEKCDQ
ncbi:uncharacterized protein BX664DRAFT_358152 [Halteromyces radiatus]|uniref:uncharacterized protein n=1 Tax=Halteromyces radiatus TaxID=101107 RepID=UPI00221E4DF8|nr:uncharacterized protein BX664DRAFT_358152 [Halteromyces radiatus]KAI8093751.1 hypothetical protein BX664DRAFT_358152 [Halteromyces radiatus]